MLAGSIIGLKPGDLTQLENLLHDNHLPQQDCADQLRHFFGLFDEKQLIAAGGLEPAGDYALLRSIVVEQGHRSQGLGSDIVEFLLRQARAQGHDAVYLLTETAESYFENFGFIAITRQQIPGPIRNTRQFASLCPDSACCMVLKLKTGLVKHGQH